MLASPPSNIKCQDVWIMELPANVVHTNMPTSDVKVKFPHICDLAKARHFTDQNVIYVSVIPMATRLSSIKAYISNLVSTARFWNDLQNTFKIKRLESQII